MTALDIHRQLFAPALLPTKRGTWPGPPPHPALLPAKRVTWPAPALWQRVPRSRVNAKPSQTITHRYTMIDMIDAAGLRVIRAIADEGSFTGAAVSLGYSQPAISQMVRRLEQRSGTVLVERVGRHVRLTEAGQVLARHAVGVLSALAAAEEEVAAIAGLRAGRVRLMAFPSSSATMVPRALALVKERFPDIKVTFTDCLLYTSPSPR